MKSIVLGSVLLLTSTSAVAEPIYLACTASSEKETIEFSITLDEQTRKITHTNGGGDAFNTEGFFTPSEINYQAIKSNSLITETKQYRIDRTTLAVVYTITAEVTDPSFNPHGFNIIYKGQCDVVATPIRKI
jgi:hypothetical protein